MNEKKIALAAIAIVIPLIMIWIAYSGGLLSKPTSSENETQSNNSSISQSPIANPHVY